MKHIIFLTVLVVFSANLFAQTVNGIIIDENKTPLMGVNVSVKESFFGATSNAKGEFSVKAKKGKTILEFSYLGYEILTKELEISENSVNLGEIQLVPTAYMADEVIVRATRSNEFSPLTNTNLSAKDLQTKNVAQDITYMLELTPSVVATSEAGTGIGATAFRVRGSDPTRINVTINGMPLNDPESQAVFWNNTTDLVSSVSSLQLTRGVGTSTNGSAAFGASLNLLTNSVSTNPYAEIAFSGGSFKTFKEHILAGTGLMKNGFSFDVRLSKLNSDGFVRNGFSDHKSFNINATWRNEKSLVRANIIHGNQKTGITWNGVDGEILFNENLPEKYRRTYNEAGMYFADNGDTLYYRDNSDNYKQTIYQLSYSQNLAKNLDLNLGLYYTRGDGYYEDYKVNRKLSELNLPNFVLNDSVTIKKTDFIRRKIMANDFYGGNFSLNYKTKIGDVVFGGNICRYDGYHFGEIQWIKNVPLTSFDQEYYRNKGIKDDASAFAKLNFEIFKDFYGYADIQYRHINYKLRGKTDNKDFSNLDETHTYNFINPKVGFFYNITNSHQIYTSFAMSNREPTRSDFKEAASSPDKTPKPETLLDYELGYNFKSSNFSATANVYFMDYFDQLIPTGERSNAGYDIMTNVERSYRAGIELMAAVKPIKQLTISANGTFSKNKINNFVFTYVDYDDDWNEFEVSKKLGKTDIAYSPEIVASGIVKYEPIKNLNFSIISKYVGSQYFDNTSSENRKLPHYWVNNFQIDYILYTKIVKEIQFVFQVNNFANVKYCNNALGGVWYEQGKENLWTAYFPQAGINFFGGVVLRF